MAYMVSPEKMKYLESVQGKGIWVQRKGLPARLQRQCVAIAQATTSIGTTKSWRQGQKVVGSDIKPGTVIASGWVKGRYLSKPKGNHTAIYLGQKDGMILVYDQWKKGPMKKRWIKGNDFYVVN